MRIRCDEVVVSCNWLFVTYLSCVVIDLFFIVFVYDVISDIANSY